MGGVGEVELRVGGRGGLGELAQALGHEREDGGRVDASVRGAERGAPRVRLVRRREVRVGRRRARDEPVGEVREVPRERPEPREPVASGGSSAKNLLEAKRKRQAGE